MERGETEDNRGAGEQITVDDVMIAIKVLKLYLKQYNEAVRVLRSLNYILPSNSYRSGDPILELAKQMMVNKTKEELPEEESLDNESLERLRKLKDRFIKEQNI